MLFSFGKTTNVKKIVSQRRQTTTQCNKHWNLFMIFFTWWQDSRSWAKQKLFDTDALFRVIVDPSRRSKTKSNWHFLTKSLFSCWFVTDKGKNKMIIFCSDKLFSIDWSSAFVGVPMNWDSFQHPDDIHWQQKRITGKQHKSLLTKSFTARVLFVRTITGKVREKFCGSALVLTVNHVTLASLQNNESWTFSWKIWRQIVEVQIFPLELF